MATAFLRMPDSVQNVPIRQADRLEASQGCHPRGHDPRDHYNPVTQQDCTICPLSAYSASRWCRRGTASRIRRFRMPAVELIGVNKWYGAFHVLKNIDLSVEKGEKIV